MEKILILILVSFLFFSCEEKNQLQKHLINDTWVDFQLETPNVTIQLPKIFTVEALPPETQNNNISIPTMCYWYENETLHNVSLITNEILDIESWYKWESETVLKQKRKIFREKRKIGQFDYELFSYTKMNSSDSSTYIGIAFVIIDNVLYDIGNGFESDNLFIKFLGGIKKSK